MRGYERLPRTVGARLPRAPGRAVLLTAALVALGLAPATAAPQTAVKGRWSAPIPWPHVAIHAHVLPNGKVLTWAREPAGTPNGQGYAPASVWDPDSGSFADVTYEATNLFCAGHAFLPDGRLLVTGGRVKEKVGPRDTNIFDFRTNSWTAVQAMNDGRWYPTTTALANGEALVIAGKSAGHMNALPQVWRTSGGWRDLTTATKILPWYPWMHVAPDGRVFYSGPKGRSKFLVTSGTGSWNNAPLPHEVDRDYGSSVMYDVGKVLVLGGGGEDSTGPAPTNTAEIIDLTKTPKVWQYTSSMAFRRRQLNATILADGKVLVTGGTREAGFNDASGAVLAAEIWNPATGAWTTVASMQIRRLYHSTAVLLPDARVLSAGGGAPAGTGLTPPDTDHLDAEIYSPPYLFDADGTLAERPVIALAPDSVAYGGSMTVITPNAQDISKVTWIRLSSVTHAFNMEQRINYLQFSNSAGQLTVVAPASPNASPPGYYMLFLLNGAGVPSKARIIHIG